MLSRSIFLHRFFCRNKLVVVEINCEIPCGALPYEMPTGSAISVSFTRQSFIPILWTFLIVSSSLGAFVLPEGGAFSPFSFSNLIYNCCIRRKRFAMNFLIFFL